MDTPMVVKPTLRSLGRQWHFLRNETDPMGYVGYFYVLESVSAWYFVVGSPDYFDLKANDTYMVEGLPLSFEM